MNTVHEEPTVAPRPARYGSGADLPYRPSYVDRFTDSVQRLPVPYGLTYLLLFILQVAAFHVLSWLDSSVPAYTFVPIHLMFPLWMWGSLAIVTYLDNVARKVLADFSTLLDNSSETARRMEYEFTTMPARAVILNGVIWTVIYILSWYLVYGKIAAAYGAGPGMTIIIFLAGFVSYFIGSVFYYHTVHQLRLVNRTVQMVAHFDLFQLNPVYSFSVLTSRTGLFWMFLLTCTVLILPVQFAPVPLLATLILQVALAVGAFVLPLRTVHHRLVMEKREHQAELDQRLKRTLISLHQRVDQNELREIPDLNNVLTALNSEREILSKIPTWPWRPGLLAGFVSIAVLPIILFLVQLALGRLLGG